MDEEPKGRVEIILPGEETEASRLWVATGAGRVKVETEGRATWNNDVIPLVIGQQAKVSL